jgi:hypothetical protein
VGHGRSTLLSFITSLRRSAVEEHITRFSEPVMGVTIATKRLDHREAATIRTVHFARHFFSALKRQASLVPTVQAGHINHVTRFGSSVIAHRCSFPLPGKLRHAGLMDNIWLGCFFCGWIRLYAAHPVNEMVEGPIFIAKNVPIEHVGNCTTKVIRVQGRQPAFARANPELFQ